MTSKLEDRKKEKTFFLQLLMNKNQIYRETIYSKLDNVKVSVYNENSAKER